MTDQTPDKPTLGILLMLGFCLVAPLSDSFGKMLAATVPVFIIVLARFLTQAVLLAPVTLKSGRAIKPHHWVPITLRTVLQIVGIALIFTALIYLPLADAIAIAFVMPFIMLLLGYWFLNEEVGPVRMAACAVGFCGTLMVVQPSFAEVGWPALLPLGVAVVFAFFMLITRQLAKEIGAIDLQAVSGLIGTAILLMALGLGTAFGWSALSLHPVTSWELVLLVGTGILGTLAHLLMTMSLKFAPAATLAPMQYLEIPAATLVGYLIFSDFPNGLALMGICVTMAAGLFIIWREQRAARRLAQVPIAPVE